MRLNRHRISKAQRRKIREQIAEILLFRHHSVRTL